LTLFVRRVCTKEFSNLLRIRPTKSIKLLTLDASLPLPTMPTYKHSSTLVLYFVACALAGAARVTDAFFLSGSPSMPLLRGHMPRALFPFHDYDDPSLLSPRHMLQTFHALQHEADRILAGVLESSPAVSASASASDIEGNLTAIDNRPHTELRLRPHFDIEDRADVFLLTAATPGLRKEDLSVEVVDGADSAAYLIVAGHTSPSLPPQTDRSGDGSACEPSSTADTTTPASTASTACLKASYSHFERRIKLPSAVERDNVKAKYENGLLSVVIPKNPKHQALRLRVPIS